MRSYVSGGHLSADEGTIRLEDYKALKQKQLFSKTWPAPKG